MLNFKKPHTWVAVFVVAVIVIVAANFLTNQKTVERKRIPSAILQTHKLRTPKWKAPKFL